MKTLSGFILLIILITFSQVSGQKKDYSKEPGYIEFGDMSSLESGEMVAEVLLEDNILKMVAKLTQNKEPELSSLVSGIKLIKVNVFEVTSDNRSSIKSKMKSIQNDIEGKGWDRIVRMKDKNEAADVYIKASDDGIIGLLVMSLDENDEAAFVNIVGNINLETIGKLGEKFDIPSLDSIK